MKFEEAVDTCHVSACIYRIGNPTEKYGKNHRIPLEERVPIEEQKYDDWYEYDPDEIYGHY